MPQRLCITVLMEHRSLRKDLATEHGFSLWIEVEDTRILFDTGQSGAFAGNARALGIDLTRADFIVLSHGHYDHTGGLKAALQAASRAQVWLHPDARLPRYSHPPGLPTRSIGMPAPALKAIQSCDQPVQLCLESQEIAKGVWISGPIPRVHPVEHPQRAFSRDEQGKDPDGFVDDLALVVDTPIGNLVFTGCCHAGVANTLERASLLTGQRGACLVGGLHLVRSSERQIRSALGTLDRAQVQGVLCGHCTGSEAEHLLGLQSRRGPALLKGLLKVGACWALEDDKLRLVNPEEI